MIRETAVLPRLVALVSVLMFGCVDEPARTADAESNPPDSIVAQSVDTGFVVALDSEGLRVVLVPSGSTRPIPFGADAREVVRTLNRALDQTPVRQGHNDECAAEFASWAERLTTWFKDDEFIGWSLDRSSPLTTMSGIGIGSTRTDLTSSYAADIRETSLGEEFNAGGLSGILDSSASDGRVRTMWAGVTCIAR